MRLLRCAALPLLLLLLPFSAQAARITLTFDSGAYDETIVGPGGEFHGPFDWLESGARIAGFWALDVGTPGAGYGQGHTHISLDSGNPTGLASSTHAWTGDLQGYEVSLLNGATFDLISIDYDTRALDSVDPAQQRLPWSFTPSEPQIVVTDAFDPTLPDFESQWTAIPTIDDGNWRTHDWYTMSFAGAGFEDLTSVLISQTANFTWFDNIVIDVHAPAPVPEPGTAVLVGLGLVGLGVRRRTGSRR